MKKSIVLLIIALCFSLSAAVDVITPALQIEMNRSGDNMIPVYIVLAEKFDKTNFEENLRFLSKDQRREYVVSELKDYHGDSQADLLNQMEILESRGEITEIRPLWITNVILCKASANAISEIALQNNIETIDHDELRPMLIEPEIDHNAGSIPGVIRDGREITWNVTTVQADLVWAQGITGTGATVAVLDTGVNYNHVDLADHLWSHNDYPYHGFDFINNDNNPMDDHGHGTHCAGTVAGDGTAGSQTGMAPDAAIMCVKLLDATGNGSEGPSWQAVQFAVEYGADVMSMSFGWQHSWGVNRAGWREVMENALYAGVIASVAAGNEGNQTWYYPIPDNVRCPGDCPPPWLHPDQILTGGTSSVVCVGATDYWDNLAGFSSHGPVDWSSEPDFYDYPYNPEMGLIRPDISAPGDNIKSLAYYSNTGYEDGWSGTSMATPCVAGIIALMISKNFTLTPAYINQLIEENVDLMQYPKNNDYGSGRINALSSVNATPAPNTPPNQALNPNPEDGSLEISPLPHLLWLNGGGAVYYQVYLGTDNPPSNVIDGDSTNVANYFVSVPLNLDTTYYWQINSYNDFGEAAGQIWEFSTVSPADESFESGDFSVFPWVNEGDASWLIDNENYYYGDYSVRSGDIDDNQISRLTLPLYIYEEGEISFYWKTSSEQNNDELVFYVDDDEIDTISGETGWEMLTASVDSGFHAFSWEYEKNSNSSSGEDCGWIDFISLPENGNDTPANLSGTVTMNPEGDLSTVNIDIAMHILIPDPEGNYAIDLPSGFYDIIVTAPGYQTFTYNNYELPPDGIVNLDIYVAGYLPPENLQAELVENSCSLTWDPPVDQNILYYKIFRNFGDGQFSFLYATTYETYTDNLIDPGVYGYYLTAVYVGMNESLPSEIVYAELTGTEESTIPAVTEFQGNYPDPFNPETNLKFQLATDSRVTIEIYNIKGNLVRTLVNDLYPAGRYQITWNGLDNFGKNVGSGIYFTSFRTDKYQKTDKMILLK